MERRCDAGQAPAFHREAVVNKMTMERICVALLAAAVIASAPAAWARETVAFVTYLGGSGEDTLRDIATDAAGNVYVTGGTASPDFPTTPGAFDTTFNTGGTFLHDVFVTKLNAEGEIIWSTLIGGPNYDRAYAIEVDHDGYVYVAGRAGAGFPVTAGAFQTTFQGGPNAPPYGSQDGFVCKLTPDGSSLVFCSYFGTNDVHIIRDLAVDRNGDIYIASTHVSGSFPPEWFRNGFQQTPPGGRDGVVAKIASDGSHVLWATYLGGSGGDGDTPSIRVDAAGSPYVLMGTSSTDMPTTAGAYNRSYNGGGDLYLAKLAADGSSLLYGTYLGGSQSEGSETHGLAVDADGAAYVAAATRSPDFPTTSGAAQTAYGGTGGAGTGFRTNYPGDIFVAKFSADGTRLLASTYVGGRVGDGAEGVTVDSHGNVYVSGATFSDNFPVTADAFQKRIAGKADAVGVILSADLSRQRYATCIGGSKEDLGRAVAVDSSGNVYVGGETSSPDFPIRNAQQASYKGGGSDAFLARIRAVRRSHPHRPQRHRLRRGSTGQPLQPAAPVCTEP